MSQLSIFEKMEIFRPVFFNTVNLTGPELVEAKVQTGVQDIRVLGLYRELGKMTPLACWRAYCGRFPACPCTSIRRSITVLTGLKMLRQLPDMVKEQYGKPNHLWEAL